MIARGAGGLRELKQVGSVSVNKSNCLANHYVDDAIHALYDVTIVRNLKLASALRTNGYNKRHDEVDKGGNENSTGADPGDGPCDA